MNLFSRNHNKLELFVRAEGAETGIFEVKKKEEPEKTVFQSEICEGPYQFLEIALEKEKEYQLFFSNVRISQMYLSGNDDIMETGVTYLMINGENMEQLRIDDILDTPFREQYHFTPFVN